jgi:thiopeptide-type bacteriocin biosynthesis protein
MVKHWNSYYLYYTIDADHLLREIVHPTVLDIQQKLEKEVKFFFIRYFENGYHIRLRMFLSAEESAQFLPLLKKHISIYKDLYKTDLSWKEAQYIPETERYGNTDTIAHAESQFHATSRFVLHHLVNNSTLTDSERYLLAMKTHLIFFKGMGLSPNCCQQVCNRFIQSWLPLPFSENQEEQEKNRKSLLAAFQVQFEAYQALLCENLSIFLDSLNTAADPFAAELLETNHRVKKKYAHAQLPSEAVDEAFLSFIHMTNNRIGIVNAEESYLLFLIMKTIPLLKDYDKQL